MDHSEQNDLRHQNRFANNVLVVVVIATAPFFAWFWIYWDALNHMVSVWSASETYKHCFFIPVISAYLIYEKRTELRQADLKHQPLVLPVLFLCQFLFLVVEQLGINLLMHFAAYASLVLIVWTTVGNRVFRIILFPMFYLGFMVPFGEELVPLLQEITADFSVLMLNIFNIPVYREGLYIYIPNGTFHVAEACAGIRFLIGTFAIGTLFAYLNYRAYWKRALFIVTCAIVPVIANGFRAFGIIIIGYLSDMEHATGADHLVYGWFFFAFVLALLFFIGSIGAENTKSATGKPDLNHTAKRRLSALSSVFLLIILLAPSYLFSLQYAPDPSGPNSRSQLNQLIHSELTSANEGENPWVGETAEDELVWHGLIDSLMTKIVYVDESQGRELVSSRHRIFDNERWTQVKFSTLPLTIDGKQAQVRLIDIVNVAGKHKKLMSWYQVEGLQSHQGLRVKWQQLMNRLNGKDVNGFFIVVELSSEKVEGTKSTMTESASDILASFAKLSLSESLKSESN